MDRAELAAVLRTARSRVRPADVGLPTGLRRQVPGLRREEVAQLAGLGVDYVIRLEQGRGPRPSTQVLGALARALRLGDDDRDMMFRLAGAEPPQAGRIPMLVRPSVLRLLDRMSDLPALVLSAKSDVLAWNPLGAALLGDFSELPTARRNLIWQRFLGPNPDTETSAAADCVGCLRTAQARYPDDPDLARLVADLRGGSARFDSLWRAGRSGRLRAACVTRVHPEVGMLTLDVDVLREPEGDQTVLIYSAAPGTATASALELLRVTGLQRFAL
ncbi:MULTISPECIES: helix-turn-helix transcriptional regulator [Actinoalloteichus]|uniref:DNA binding protein with helix-turn-helix domain n=1 Tax=Actinoalloteichus fjordicus TaxID=1612552 RepID=A0AAC9LFS3_9PSEU|nr:MULTISPECIES: helix-turn-helix transcriptional regulator [Actinoalloteichus]APU16876.1 DNA binding protein with helix-turn-helix domain [Actinoalloteichus fjordicus]APU22956.1 DNA binding protein with helix-turn-helix domain [Actinoalloteichus sp. GBA129-24]